MRSRAYLIAACVLAVLGVASLGVGLFLSESTASDPLLLSDTGPSAVPVQAEVEPPKPAEPVQPPLAEDVVMAIFGSADTYVLQGEPYLEAGCRAFHPQEGDLTDTVTAQGVVDTDTAGTYEVVYTAEASDGSLAEAVRTVHVVDGFEEAAVNLPVLMYHYVYSAAAPPDDLNGNYIECDDLEAQLRYLSENDYYYPSFEEVAAFAEGTHTLPAKSVVLTFDDGEVGFLDLGIPLLERYRVPATSFLICSDDDAAQKLLDHPSEYVTFQSHSYAMHRAGSNVGRGGIIHAMDADEIADDLRQAQAILGTTQAFAYPFGDNNEQAQEALRNCGVLCAFTINNDRIYPGDDPTLLSRVRISGEYSQDSFEYLVSPNNAD